MWYLFGLIAAKEREFSEKTFRYKNIAIVAKEIESLDLSKLNRVKLLTELLNYQQTLEKIMLEQLIIPIKFGTVVDSLEDIQTILEINYDRFQQILKEMEGKVEISLAGTWDEKEQIIEISNEDQEICEMKAEAQHTGDVNFLVKIGKALASKIEEKKIKIADEICKELEYLTIAKEDHERIEDRMILNSSFLIAQEKEESFVECITKIEEKFQKKIQFKYISPLPPYSFCTIFIQKPSSQELKGAIDLFEIREDTTFENLKTKYRELIIKFHPDGEGEHKEEDFSKVHNAFNLLKSFYLENEKPFVNLDKEHCFLTTISKGSSRKKGG